ncbi:MAG: MFS transporter [Saprospiraceae bacterium]|nr:MFS transporter [Saprospiraceae bacterium]
MTKPKNGQIMPEQNWKTKLTLLLVSSLTIMSVITISPALPQMSVHFASVDNAELLVKLILTVPALFIAIFSPLTGWIIDRYGRLKILTFAIVLYAVSGTAGYYLENIYHILLSRAVLGISVGMSMTIVITLVADYFEGHERQKFAGIQVAFMSIGGILFIGLGGVLADIGWRLTFLIYLFALIILPLSILYLYEPPSSLRQKKIVSSDRSPRLIWILFFNTMLMWILFFIIPVQIPFYLKSIGIEKNSLIGIAIATSTLFSAISSFSYVRFKDHFSFKMIFTLGFLFMALGFFLISQSGHYSGILVAMMLSGFGIGMMIPNTNIWVMKIAPIEIRGKEIGKLTMFWFFGQFISPIVMLPLLRNLPLGSTFLAASGVLFLFALAWFVFSWSGRQS